MKFKYIISWYPKDIWMTPPLGLGDWATHWKSTRSWGGADLLHLPHEAKPKDTPNCVSCGKDNQSDETDFQDEGHFLCMR